MTQNGGSSLPPDKQASRTDEVSAAFAAQYTEYQYCFVEFLVEHLIDVGRGFDGDMQAVLVLAIIGQVRLQAVSRAEAARLDPLSIPPDQDRTNASRIADVTGIPRQTVRRKLDALHQKGWVERDQAGSYRLVVAAGTSAARRDLADLDRRALLRVSRLFVDLERLLTTPATRSD